MTASTTIDARSVALSGLRENATPETSESTMRWRITPIRGGGAPGAAWRRYTRLRAEYADAQHFVMDANTCSSPRWNRNDSYCPAKERCAESSPMPLERTATSEPLSPGRSSAAHTAAFSGSDSATDANILATRSAKADSAAGVG